jgi:hypothetical protein
MIVGYLGISRKGPDIPTHTYSRWKFWKPETWIYGIAVVHTSPEGRPELLLSNVTRLLAFIVISCLSSIPTACS